MRSDIKENLENLSKEQLIYIIAQYDIFYTTIGEICVSESKMHINSKEAIKKIRNKCCDIQYDVDIADEHIGDLINMKLEKITPEEYRKIVLGIKETPLIENEGTHLTIGDLIKIKDYDYVEYRYKIATSLTPIYKADSIFAGAFKTVNGKIISLDGDNYSQDQEVILYEEWEDPEEGIKNGLTVVV
jgi:hypothetical protein